MKLLDQSFPDSYYINPKYLGVSRIVYGLIIIIFADLPSYSWLGQENLTYFFVPPSISIAKPFNDFPGVLFFQAITLISLFLFFLMFIGLWCRWTSLLFSLTSILGHSFWYSFGKVDHSLLWIITPIFLGFAGWGDYFSVGQLFKRKTKVFEKTPAKQNSLWVSLFALSIAFAMFTSGVAKIKGGWLNWELEAVHFHLIRNYFSLNKTELLATYFLEIDNHILWKAMDYSALVLEIGFLISFTRRKWFSFFIAGAVLFHFVVALMFNIFFSANLIAYVVFINWEHIDKRIGISRLISDPARYRRSIKFALVFSIMVLFYWLNHFFTYNLDLRFPGLLQTSLEILGVHDSRDIAVDCLFAASILILIFTVIAYYKGDRSPKEEYKSSAE